MLEIKLTKKTGIFEGDSFYFLWLGDICEKSYSENELGQAFDDFKFCVESAKKKFAALSEHETILSETL